jgi:hypothetical protein
MTAPLWRDMECKLISRGLAPNMDWSDYGAMLEVIRKRMVLELGTSRCTGWLYDEVYRADCGEHT